MWGFRPRGTGKIVPEFITPPADVVDAGTSEAQQLAEARARIDEATRALDALAKTLPSRYADRVLDARLALHPPARVPVIPGRPS